MRFSVRTLKIVLPALLVACVSSHDLKLPNASHTTRLTGIVRFEDGAPAPDATVRYMYRDGARKWQGKATTHADGRYMIDGIPAPRPSAGEPFIVETPIQVSVEDPRPGSSYVETTVAKVSSAPRTAFDIRFRRPCTLAGKIIDDRTGNPLGGVGLEIVTTTGEASQPADRKLAFTDSNGQFRATVRPGSASIGWRESCFGNNLIDGEWLTKQPGNYAHQPFHADNMITDQTDILLKLRTIETQPFTGTVVDSKHQPVANAWVYMNPSILILPITTDDAGVFAVTAVPKYRDFELVAALPDQSQACLVKVAAGSTTAQLELRPLISVTGDLQAPAALQAKGMLFLMALRLNGVEQGAFGAIAFGYGGKFEAYGLIADAQYSITMMEDLNGELSPATVDLAELKHDGQIHLQIKMKANARAGR